jgi:hypothetical protein
MLLTRTKAVIAAIAIATGVVATGTGTAEAITPSKTVKAGSGANAISWRTPALPTRHAAIASIVGGDGAASIITLKDSSAPTSYDFPVTLRAGGALIATADGGFDMTSPADHAAGAVSVGHIDPPWAKDATGKNLPTSFTLNGSTLTQHVNTTGAQYPVTADPHYTWGWISGTVYFNRSETIKAAVSTAFIAGVGAFAPPPFDLIMAASAGWYSVVAGWASADNKCLKINTNGYAGEYGGGYCR